MPVFNLVYAVFVCDHATTEASEVLNVAKGTLSLTACVGQFSATFCVTNGGLNSVVSAS